ncbi:hypothetical protein ABZS66_02565 [Dactylosporangium sp. NPDC005572]|uniref:hypothetical protein n=1 Tax=Dactylosporangium sp. NPDC005572 TaxID=3156889 RepID=UPI0033BED6A7
MIVDGGAAVERDPDRIAAFLDATDLTYHENIERRLPDPDVNATVKITSVSAFSLDDAGFTQMPTRWAW